MSFNVLFIAHAPDADKHKHRSEIDTLYFFAQVSLTQMWLKYIMRWVVGLE